ncbi:MAG: hypothetical protein E4H14_15045 [Candidatus Thorarchaeota archaeon]|nr:MAG: hypothetical protein E4H14_15045 [Candidatus Thorarchaeota archaeon]
MSDPLPEPEKEIRSDLWPTMGVSELNKQRDLVLDKLSLARSMQGFTPATITIGLVLEQALKDLTELIDNRASQKPELKGHDG